MKKGPRNKCIGSSSDDRSSLKSTLEFGKKRVARGAIKEMKEVSRNKVVKRNVKRGEEHECEVFLEGRRRIVI